MILRPTVFIFLAWILSAISCSRRQYPVQTTQTTSVTTITEVQHDTIVTIQPDTSMLQALIECDSTGQAYLREINQLKSSSYLHQSLNLTNNVLTATAVVDSMDIYLTYKDRYQETTNTTTETKTVTVTTNIMKPWQQMLMYLGAIAALAIAIRLFFRNR